MNALLASPGLSRLGWALVHSLWEVTLVVLVSALVLRLLRGRSPRLRYAVAVAALLVSVLLPVRRIVVSADASTQTWVERVPASVGPAPLEVLPDATSNRPTPVAAHLERSLPWIVGAWSLGKLICLLRLAGGWIWLQRLRWRKAELSPDALQARLLDLCRRAGLKRAVTLLTCEGLHGPSVVGFLRPAILVPAGWFLNLPPDHVEALLAHELAHVLRHDYAVNLLQSLVEILLFYHPGVWWLSKRIRAERELACDAFAVRLMGDSLPLAEALLNLETRALGHLSYELSPAAHGGSLMERIRQLLFPQPRTSTAPVAGALILGLCVIALPVAGHSRTPSTLVPPSPLSTGSGAVVAAIPRATPENPSAAAVPEPPRVFAIAKQPATMAAPAVPGDAIAVLVRKNKLDEEGHPIPYEWVISIQARNAPLLQVWDAFDALMSENLGSRGETRKTLKTADVGAGRGSFTFDLVDATPTAVLRTFELSHGGPRHPAPAGQGVELPAGFSLVKRTDSSGVPRFDVSLKRISRTFLGMWLDVARKEARATDRPENACLSARADDIYPGPKVDAVFTNVTLAELEKGVEVLLQDR